MTPNHNWTCWGITDCKDSKECLARKNPDKPCWEIARTADDYRNALNVCPDCVVYLINKGDSVLSEEELKGIVAQKNACVLSPEYSPAAM